LVEHASWNPKSPTLGSVKPSRCHPKRSAEPHPTF
jgi:hypothetical protein